LLGKFTDEFDSLQSASHHAYTTRLASQSQRRRRQILCVSPLCIYTLIHQVTSLFDLTFAEPIHWVKVRSKYLLKPKSEAILLSERVQKYGLSTYLDRSLVELRSK